MTSPETTLPKLCICGEPDCHIPYGLCHCGCGKKTTVAKLTTKRLGHVRGRPIKFLTGHANRIKPVLTSEPPFIFKGVSCRRIELTHGVSTIVNEDKYAELMQRKWWASPNYRKGTYYAVCKIDGNLVGMHRVVLGLTQEDPRDGDHISGNSLDNRIENLRPGPRLMASKNTGMYAHNTSGIKGVSWHKLHRRYAANIRVNGKLIHLGYRDDIREAESLRLAAEEKYFGEFSRNRSLVQNLE